MSPIEEPLSHKIFDQNYLKDEQYRSADNLQARINLHRAFGTNGYPWQRWVYDHLGVKPGHKVIEIGCGPGGLWYENVALIPGQTSLFLGDLSIGMVQTALKNLCQNRAELKNMDFSQQGFCVDVQHIPYAEASFDLVIANHMLYHAPDINQAISELRRIVKADGKVITATNGVGHMRQIGQLIGNLLPGYRDGHRSQVRRYALENGPQLLLNSFRKVETIVYEDNLQVTSVQPLLDYIRSLWDTVDPRDHHVQEQIVNQVQSEIDQKGFYLIEKSQGMLVAYP